MQPAISVKPVKASASVAKAHLCAPELRQYISRILFAVLVARRVADKLVVFRKLRRRAHHLRNIEMYRLQLEGQLIESDPRFRIHLRVVNRYGEF